MNGVSPLYSILDLLLSRAHKVVIVGLMLFFLGPTILSGVLVWKLMTKTDQMMSLVLAKVEQHEVEARAEHTMILQTLTAFIERQETNILLQNGLLFEVCLDVGNDGPARARCRAVMGR